MTERPVIDCPNCGGEGIVRMRHYMWVAAECPQCEGYGWVYEIGAALGEKANPDD